MATKFLEPGGDADFLVGTTNGFWKTNNGTVAVATDFVHGTHIKSLSFTANGGYGKSVTTPVGTCADTGTRISFYFYIQTLPSSTSTILNICRSDGTVTVVQLRLTSTGILQLWNISAAAQIGTNGATLLTGIWYRISLAYTITSTTVNRFEQFVNGVSSISITNATLNFITSSVAIIGSVDGNPSYRGSDFYIDDSSTLTDTGDIWVTAKRPNANGTTNNFVTQIGSGGSGYGSGHSPQVNERPLDTTNGWSVVAVGATTEEYNIESASTGDMNIASVVIVDYVGWVSTKALVGETVNIIINSVNFSQAITSTITLYTAVAGSSMYPAGTGADIGITTDATATTVSLYECGIIFAFIPTLIMSTTLNNYQFADAGNGVSATEKIK